MFGEFIKEKRLEIGLSLREFCRQLDEDASNWSKVERGMLSPPKDENKLVRIADILRIERESSDWGKLHDFADIDSGKIPDYIMEDTETLKMLPIFFRTIGSEKPSQEDIDRLIKNLRKGK